MNFLSDRSIECDRRNYLHQYKWYTNTHTVKQKLPLENLTGLVERNMF